MKIAIIKTGGKQHKVSEGKIYKFEKLDKKTGSSVTFDKVLFYNDGQKSVVGKPVVKGVKVTGKIIEQGKSKKIIVVKYKSKIRYRRKKGHRQLFTKVKINKIG